MDQTQRQREDAPGTGAGSTRRKQEGNEREGHEAGTGAGNGRTVGAAMVVGGGIAGIQASLDLAESGYKVTLVENKSAIGGHMAQLDKTFRRTTVLCVS